MSTQINVFEALREAEAGLEVAIQRILKRDPDHAVHVTSEAKALVMVRQALQGCSGCAVQQGYVPVDKLSAEIKEPVAVLIERFRSLPVDHKPDGWPAVQTKEITALLDHIADIEGQLDAIGAGGVESLRQSKQHTLVINEENRQLRLRVNELEARIAALHAITTAAARAGTVYVSGPMTGYVDLNFPAFNAEAAKLREQGLKVTNPADHGEVPGAQWADYLRTDVAQLAACERIHLLPGWSKSNGALLELYNAKAFGMQITLAEGAEPLELAAPLVGQQEVPAPFMYAIADGYGQPFFEEQGCVSSEAKDLQPEVDSLNENLDGEPPYKVIAVYAQPTQQGLDAVGAVTNEQFIVLGHPIEKHRTCESLERAIKLVNAPGVHNKEEMSIKRVQTVELTRTWPNFDFPFAPPPPSLTAPTLDNAWKARLLDGRELEREEHGFGFHPELPEVEESTDLRKLFELFGIEIECISADEDLDCEQYDRMSGTDPEGPFDFTDWKPSDPTGEGWKLVSIHDTEDGPYAMWLREAVAAQAKQGEQANG